MGVWRCEDAGGWMWGLGYRMQGSGGAGCGGVVWGAAV